MVRYFRRAFLPALAAALAALCLPARPALGVLAPDEAQKLYDRVSPSLVAVQYTFASELGKREIIGAGVVVGDDGLIVASMAMFPVQFPNEQLTEFKVIVPGDEEIEIDATFQGRDERSGLAFVKAKEPPAGKKWQPIKFEEAAVKVGQTVASVGLLPKQAGYKPYLTQASVSAVLRGPTPQVLVSADGVGVVGSPVFAEDGKAIGLVNFVEQSPLLNDPRNPLGTIVNPARLYVPARDFLQSFKDQPAADKPVKLPWMGVAQLIGLKKEVAEFYGLKNQPAVQVGDVIAGFGAEKAGLKSGDVIVKMNGKTLERGDEPDEAAQILMHEVRRMKPGEKVTFSVLSEKDKPLKDVTMTLDERPRQPNETARFFADDLGFAVRELVFEDTYERKLPADTKGVVVALLKPSSAAQTARLQPNDLVTKLNQSGVTDLTQFKTQYQEFRKANPREAVVLEVLRGVNTQVIRIEAPQ